MFSNFANVWTPVFLSKRLKDKPLPVTLANERLVFFRDAKGKAAALIDRCPHRGVALSLGRVTPNGNLECPFHAWQFDGSGAACHIPLNPDAKRDQLFAQSLPTREVGGVLWVYTAVTHSPPCEPTVPEALTRPGLAFTHYQVEWRGHWTRAMENMLDSPHVPFVHATTIGRFVRPYLRADSKMDISWEDTPYGGQTRAILDDRPDSGATLSFYKPNMMVLEIPIPKKVFRMHAFCVPVNDGAVRMIIVGARDFLKWSWLNPLFNWQNARIASQDRAIVETSWPPEVPPAGQEKSVRTDKATLKFRSYYFNELKTDPRRGPTPAEPG
jgi:phenylpropionate dioxygenase-like ring-hydroxylating dioxygenase large terminal subunit